jgi:hypothetical protein
MTVARNAREPAVILERRAKLVMRYPSILRHGPMASIEHAPRSFPPP